MLFKIAWRNLRAQPRKTLIIGILVALAVMLMVVGNSAATSVQRSIENGYTKNLTGDIILRTETDDFINFLGDFSVAPTLDNYQVLTEALDKRDDVINYAPALHSVASIKYVFDNDNDSDSDSADAASEADVSDTSDYGAFIALWGIDPRAYFDMFAGSYNLVEGDFWQTGETGIVLSTATRADFAEEGIELEVGDTLSISSQNSTTGTKIRRLIIRGFGDFSMDIEGFEDLAMVDPGTVRYLSGLTLVKTSAAAPSEAIVVDEDSFFGGGGIVSETVTSSDAETESSSAPVDYDNILGDTSVREQFLALDNNAWQFVMLDLAEGIDPVVHKTVLQDELKMSEGLEVESWRWGVNQILTLATGLQVILNVSVIIIAVVSIIIIMNTLVISITERITEIGTIRAIGGQKGFVRRMVVIEVLTIMVIFGIIGALLGTLIVSIFHATGIPATNNFLQVIFGGKTLKPSLAFNSVWWSLLAVVGIGIVASLYPTAVALGISPARAMQKR